MSLMNKLTDLLERNAVPYEMIRHPRRFKAIETAVAEDAPEDEFAKVVMVKVAGKHAMFVIPANRKLSLAKVREQISFHDIHIEKEDEFKSLFPDCELGAMPPFGSLFGIPCYVDIGLTNEREIFFNAGDHEESIKIETKHYLRLAEAIIGDYSDYRQKDWSEEGYIV